MAPDNPQQARMQAVGMPASQAKRTQPCGSHARIACNGARLCTLQGDA